VATSLSVVVPVLADQEHLTRLLRQIAPDSRLELIVVDGGSYPMPRLVDRPDVTVIHSPRGRARQMNAGAARATGEWILFLHADSVLPAGWIDGILTAPDGVAGGWFRFGLNDPAWQARVIEMGVALRVRVFGLAYGDQGIFVSRREFDAMGGYREMPLMEDVEFVRRLTRRGTIFEVPLTLRTSARRWTRDGWLRRSVRNLALVMLYFAGLPPERLSRWYSR
jgi:rSAM/selenodomain-associated transferase 2